MGIKVFSPNPTQINMSKLQMHTSNFFFVKGKIDIFDFTNFFAHDASTQTTFSLMDGSTFLGNAKYKYNFV